MVNVWHNQQNRPPTLPLMLAGVHTGSPRLIPMATEQMNKEPWKRLHT